MTTALEGGDGSASRPGRVRRLREGSIPERYIETVKAVNSYRGKGRTSPPYVKLSGQLHTPAALPQGKGHQFPFE